MCLTGRAPDVFVAFTIVGCRAGSAAMVDGTGMVIGRGSRYVTILDKAGKRISG